MRQAVQDGLDLAQRLAALPFRAARQALQESRVSQRPLGEVVADSLALGEDLARLPFKATAALLTEWDRPRETLEERVRKLEERLGLDQAPSPSTTSEST